MATFKFLLGLHLAILSFLTPATCGNFNWDLPKCTTPNCYGYEKTWTLTAATKAGDIGYIAINGEWSADPIIIKKGDRLRINVVNNLLEDVTLHFHGILQKNMYTLLDGPQGITQSGIFPGASFTYDFKASEAGSYWIHSHAPGQYPKGLRVPLVVTDSDDLTTYDYESKYDQVIAVSDWWKNFTDVEENYLPKPGVTPESRSKCGPGIESYPFRAIMNDNIPEINGRARTPGSVIATVPVGKKARLRFINTSAYARFYIYIPNHKMNVIELDGVSMFAGPDTDGIEVASGQRVSVTVTGNQDSTKNYGIVAAIDPRLNSGSLNTAWNNNYPECVWDATATAGGDRSAVEYVVGALTYDVPHTGTTPLSFDTSSTWLTRIASSDPNPLMRYRLNVPWQTATYNNKNGNGQKVPLYPWTFNETDLIPLDRPGKLVDVQNQNIHFMELIDTPKFPGNQWGSINSNRFQSPEAGNTRGKLPAIEGAPALLRILQKGNTAIDSPSTYVNSKQTIVMQKDEIHWFVIRGNLGDHPIHMHGHAFQILGHRLNDVSDTQWADTTTLPDVIKTKVLPYANQYPAMRDTLMVEKYTISVIAIKADNPGVWAMHCHNDFHAVTGMMMQLIESPGTVRDTIGTFEAISNTTGNYLIAYDPPTGKAPVAQFDAQARQAWHNGMNLWWNYWIGR